MLAFNPWIVEPFSPKTLGSSAISFVVSGVTCVIGAALENGLLGPFWVTSIVVVVITSTFSWKRLLKRRLLWTKIHRVSRMPTRASQPAFYLDRPSIRFLTYVFFCTTGLPQVNDSRLGNTTAHHSFYLPAPCLDRSSVRFLTHFFSTGPPQVNDAHLSNP